MSIMSLIWEILSAVFFQPIFLQDIADKGIIIHFTSGDYHLFSNVYNTKDSICVTPAI